MVEFKKIIIGIQARCTSDRFPRKVLEPIEGKPMIQHVIDSAYNSTGYLNRWSAKNQMVVNTVLLIPQGDELKSVLKNVKFFEGPEHDVLTRYHMMAKENEADFVVRLTGDCPFIYPALISKHIQCSLNENYDYLSNVDDRFRTAPDGLDCEVISRGALDWLNDNAKTPYDREHVTTLLRREPPHWAETGHMIGFIDQAGLKLSIDTPEDLERVRFEFHKIKRMLENAEKLRGKKNIHRF